MPEGFEETQRYWVDEPYACITILFDKIYKIYKYHVVEPSLSSFEWYLLERIYSDLQDVLTIEDTSKSDDKITVLTNKTLEILWQYRVDIDESSIFKILYLFEKKLHWLW
ncbi:MAG: hypothetical protein P1P80_08660 [ANME-2 cluster archaeon]|nr:hypothetical protein [ANME-2 cluster archaeon]